ncbi:MAG: FliM/FliN family flagellar motor switch protein [Romboutsia sp.]|nr:FliM/FliN family flagellar motor switch protein [Romboutsia sp.]
MLKHKLLTSAEVNMLSSHLTKILSSKTINSEFKLNNSLDSNIQARPYNFKEPDKFSRAQLQTLNILFESFAREATAHLTNITHAGCEVNVVSVEQKSYQEIVRNMPDLTIINIFTFKNFEGQGILEMSPETLFCIIEKAFGGVGGVSQKIRDLTSIERKIQTTLMETFLGIMQGCFENLTVLEPKLEQIETNPQFIQQLAPPMEICANIMLKVRISGYRNSGLINISLPFSMLESLTSKLNSHLWFVETKSNDKQSVFKDKITTILNHSEVELRFELGKVNLKFEDVKNLKKDSIIILNTKKDEPVTVYLENTKKFLGTPHLIKDNKVVRILSVIEDEN